MRAGSIKAYAVASDTRLAMAPDIPTFGEMGLPALSYSGWFGLFAPKGTPRDIISKAQCGGRGGAGRSSGAISASPISAWRFSRASNRRRRRSTHLQKADAEKWWPIIKEFGIKAQ